MKQINFTAEYGSTVKNSVDRKFRNLPLENATEKINHTFPKVDPATVVKICGEVRLQKV